MKYQINSINELKELKELNFNNPYTQRQFILTNKDQVDYLIKNYRNNFAFAFDFKNGEYVVIKEDGIFYIRDNKKYEFKSVFDQPPVLSIYCVKSDNIEDIINYAIQ